VVFGGDETCIKPTFLESKKPLSCERYLDIVLTNAGSNTVSLLLGNANGTFQSHVDFITGTAPGGLAIGDFNGDGDPDVAVVNTGSDTVSIMIQHP
jgi:hypothetical protein